MFKLTRTLIGLTCGGMIVQPGSLHHPCASTASGLVQTKTLLINSWKRYE